MVRARKRVTRRRSLPVAPKTSPDESDLSPIEGRDANLWEFIGKLTIALLVLWGIVSALFLFRLGLSFILAV